MRRNNSFSQTGRIKSSGPFCTWIRPFGLFRVLLAKFSVLILFHKLGNRSRSGHCAPKHGFWSFQSIARQMRRNNLSHKLAESSRMGHSAPEHGFLGFRSLPDHANAANYLFPTNWAKQVEWAILHLNTAFWAFRSLAGQRKRNNSFLQTGRIKSSGPFCTWNQFFGLLGVFLAKWSEIILSHTLRERSRMGHSGPDGQIQRNNSFSQTGRIKSSGPFCTWIRLFGLFGVLVG